MIVLGVLGAAFAAVLSAGPANVIPPASEVIYRHEIYRDADVTGYMLDIPPGRGTQMHRHDKDILTIFISGGRTTAVFEGFGATSDALPAGTVRYRTAGFAHSTRNDDRQPFRAVILEFDASQGARTEGAAAPQLFCTKGFCVNDATLQPGSTLAGERRSLFIAVENLAVREVSGVRRSQPAGTVWTGPNGWTNDGRKPARVISIAFR